MVMIVRGKSVCAYCQKTISDGDDVVAFPAFVWNELDPLMKFSDAAWHCHCFNDHPLKSAAQARYDLVARHTSPGARKCFICGKPIMDQRDYILIPFLTDEVQHALYPLNLLSAHRSSLRKWPGLPKLKADLENLARSGKWRGEALTSFLEELTHL